MQTDSGYSESRALVTALQNPDLYDHPVDSFQLIETHISWVFLTGQFAYKMKKPVRFGFLDFSSLDLRKQYCEEELRLNRRYAPDLYLAVIPVTGSLEQPRLGGTGEVIEYLVKMCQFAQQNLLSHLAETGCLTVHQIDEMADAVAGHHVQAEHAGENMIYGTAETVAHWVEENFTQVMPLLKERKRIDRFTELQGWCVRELDRCREFIGVRKREGFVRDCHGDLHLGNMTLIDNRVTLFDCIEFNPELRWIDVISEVAFVFMDLQHRGYPVSAWRFINRYLQHSGDYGGIRLLRYYLVYRALVRAKVAALRVNQAKGAHTDIAGIWKEYGEYIDLALEYTGGVNPAMILMHGLSGSGKSTLAGQLAGTLGAFQIRSDVERKRLFDLAAAEHSESGLDTGIYTADATVQTYTRLEQLAEKVIDAGYPVIVDAAFLQYERREQFIRLAKNLDVPFILIDCSSPTEILRSRIMQRVQTGRDPSEADIKVLEKQMQTRDLLSREESVHAITVDTSQSLEVEGLADLILDRLSRCRILY